MELEQPRKEKIRYAILIPIIVHQFLMASVTANISFQTYIISYLYHYAQDLDQNKSYFLTPCFILGSYLFAFLGGILEKKLGLKLSIIIADVIVFLGDALMLCTKLIGLFYACFIIFGMGYSLTIISLTKLVYKDSSRKGIMNGIISVGTALGASLYNIIGEFVFINPEGKKTTINYWSTLFYGPLHSYIWISTHRYHSPFEVNVLRANFMNLKSQIILKNILF